MIELVRMIRPTASHNRKGISSFIQCVMPDNSKRIRATCFKAMNDVLFTLNSMHPETKVDKHPKMFVIFNDVSLYEKVDEKDFDKHIKKINKLPED